MHKIRVGMIRCDLHAIYYTNLMQEHDPHILRETAYGKQGGYFYFYTNNHNPDKMAFPLVPGFEVVKLWDEDRRQAESMSKIYYSKPKICDNLEEVSDDVDLVFIADCNGDGSDKLKLAVPGIKKGIPTFLDKPLAYDVEDARKLVRMANRYKAPIMSLSILRELPQVRLFRNRFTEIGEPEFGIIKTAEYHTMASHIHAISLAQHLFGVGVESVECMGQTPLAYVHLGFGENPGRPRRGIMLNCDCGRTWHCGLYASAYSRLGAIHSPAFSDYEFPWGCIEILKKIRKMALTRKPQASYEEMVECIAIATAARTSQKEHKQVFLKGKAMAK